MVTLASLDGGSLVPDLGQGIQQGIQIGGQLRRGFLTPDLVERVQQGDQSAIAELAQLNPQALQSVFAGQQAQRDQQVQQARDQVTNERTSAIKRQGFIKQTLKGGPQAIRNNLARIAGANQDDPDFDADEIIKLANLAVTDPDRAERELNTLLDAATAEIDIADRILSLPTAGAKGFQKTGSFLVRNPDGTTSIATGVFDPSRGTLRTETATFGADQVVSRLGETAEEQSQRRITEAGGKAEAEAIVELETKPTIAAATQAAKASITRSEKAFDSIGKIKQSTLNIDEAIRLIDEGAKTGVVASRLPSIRQASIELDNLQGKMGLDIIGTTTFGALSQAELEFALATALPKKLKGPDLKRWLQRKKDAQLKLSAYLERVATFLGTPGNTVKDFIELEKLNQLDLEAGVSEVPGAQPVAAPTVLQFDAQGNPV